MAKKKKPDETAGNGAPTNGTAVADAPAETPPAAQPEARDAPTGEPAKPSPNRPAAHFAAYSDRTTRVEVAVWAKTVVVSAQEEYTQYALTLSRSWQREGVWQGNAAFRAHDVPVLLFLVRQAYDWCLAQRTSVTIGDEPLPF
jgi:hypothetical protein